jgi:tRNA A-37 threonylcarbamoyl transferase component Bud32
MSSFFHLDPSVRPLFQQNGVADMDTLMKGEIGVMLSKGRGGREVLRLELQEGDQPARFFLKRRGPEPLWRLLRLIACMRRPWSGPMRELLLLQQLRAAGFAAMEPVAWGERRRFGVPTSGFLVVREVQGRNMADVFDEASVTERHALVRTLGELVGCLHVAGFVQPVRLKDLILTPDAASAPRVFVLIDRETGKPWKRRFRLSESLGIIARAARRTLRDGHQLEAGFARAFIRGYHCSLSLQGYRPIQLRGVAAQLIDALRCELGSDGSVLVSHRCKRPSRGG